jgi:hypothetical protein
LLSADYFALVTIFHGASASKQDDSLANPFSITVGDPVLKSRACDRVLVSGGDQHTSLFFDSRNEATSDPSS